MMSTSELIEKINARDLPERLTIVQAVLKSMRCETKNIQTETVSNSEHKPPGILKLAGRITHEEGEAWLNAINEAK